MQPASLRLWNSSFRSGCPVSSLRDRKPSEERIAQPFSSFIFTVHEYGPLCFCFHYCTRDICSHCGEDVAHCWVYIMVDTPLPADVDVISHLLCLLASPSSSFLLRWRRTSLSPWLSLGTTSQHSSPFNSHHSAHILPLNYPLSSLYHFNILVCYPCDAQMPLIILIILITG